MDMISIIKNLKLADIWGAVAAAASFVLGIVAKALADKWNNTVKWRQDLNKLVFQELEQLAPTYFLMSNHAYLLSSCLDEFISKKTEFQLLYLEIDDPKALTKSYEDSATPYADQALFYSAKLFYIIRELMWIKGGSYFMPDRWGRLAITD